MVIIAGEPWFVGADILTFLYGRAGGLAHAFGRLDDVEKRKVKRIHLGMKPGRDAIVVSESGLYKLVLRSDKPEAKPFQDWVTRDVLPAIRKDGSYVMGEEKVLTGEMTEDELMARAFVAATRKLERLGAELAEVTTCTSDRRFPFSVECTG